MLLEQTHFPIGSPNWGKILLISVGCLIAGVAIYQIVMPQKTIISEKKSNKTNSSE